MSATTVYTYTIPGNYTFDSSKIEITGGVAKLIDNKPTNAESWATYTTNIDLNFGGGTLTGTPVGAPVITGNKLDLSGGGTDYVDYDATLNTDSQQVGAIKFKLTPNYTTTPAADQNFIAISQASGNSNNLISIEHTSAGIINIKFLDQTAAFIFYTNRGTWSPTSGVEYEFELNWDLTAGATRLFIDGIELGITDTGTGTRSSSIGLFRVGSNETAAFTSDFLIADVVYFQTVQHTANYTPSYVLSENRYATDTPTVKTNSTFKSSDLQSFVEASTIGGTDGIQHTIIINGQDKWWTGSIWANSNGTFAQSNIESDINTNITTLIVNTRSTVGLKSFLSSSNGTSTPSLDSLTIIHDATLNDPILPTLADLEGFLYNAGTDRESRTVQVRPYLAGWTNVGIFQSYVWTVIATTDSEGFWSGSVFVQPTGQYWEIKFQGDPKRYRFQMPDQTEVDFSTLTIEEIS